MRYLVLGGQQRDHGGRLQIAAVDPLFASRPSFIPAVPLGQRGAGVRGRPTCRARLGQQRRVVRLGGPIRVGAGNAGNRAIEIAIPPLPDAVVAPHVGQLPGCIAPGIATVGPVASIQVEVLGREQVHRQRLNAGRRLAALGGRSRRPERSDAKEQRDWDRHRQHPLVCHTHRPLPFDRPRYPMLEREDAETAGRGQNAAAAPA